MIAGDPIAGEPVYVDMPVGSPVVFGGLSLLSNPVSIDVVQMIEDPSNIPTHYVHEQTSQSTVWVIQHDLGYDPAGVVVTDEVGNLHWPMVTYPSPGNIIQLSFTNPVRGICRLS